MKCNLFSPFVFSFFVGFNFFYLLYNFFPFIKQIHPPEFDGCLLEN
jgi:hypothetical protein